MKKILILVSDITSKDEVVVNYLNNNLKTVIKTFKDISFKIDSGNIQCFCEGADLKEFDLVYFRKTGSFFNVVSSVAEFLSMNKRKFIDESFINVSPLGNKLLNTLKLARANLPVVPSYFVSKANLVKEGSEIAKQIGFPVYIKNLSGHKRVGIFIANSKEDFKKTLKIGGGGFLLQKQIKIKEEYRVVVMGDKVAAIHIEEKRRTKNNEILVDDGESTGGWVKSDIVNSALLEAAVKATKVLNLNISGVDMCIEENTNKIYIIEVNRLPGFTLDPLISPELPELATYISKLID